MGESGWEACGVEAVSVDRERQTQLSPYSSSEHSPSWSKPEFAERELAVLFQCSLGVSTHMCVGTVQMAWD